MPENLSEKIKDIFIEKTNYLGIYYNIVEEKESEDLTPFYFNRKDNTFYYGGTGGGIGIKKTNSIEIDVKDYKKQYVFNYLNFEIPAKKSRDIEITIFPNESCQFEYEIKYFYKEEEIKDCNKCSESATVKIPQFKLNINRKIQLNGHVYNVLVENNIINYKKDNLTHIDKQISSNLEDIKKLFEIQSNGNAPS